MIREILDESSVAEFWREEGREEGRRETAPLMLESRFGPLGTDILTKLQEAGAPPLLAVVCHLATDSWEQVRQRPGVH